ncbi:cobamide remodeling phosphodiesterase CbiR [Geovibrio thiophilus]|nr:cobamide remodeling phosphodiesterase CbiR [Geovibrio thiophilus]
MRIAAPSFIKRADRITNVRFLQEFVDEVELLYMSSLYEGDEPDPAEVAELAATGMRFNVHMPYDIDLSKKENWAVIERYAELLLPLEAHTHTLHIQKEDSFFEHLINFIAKTDLPVTLENGGDDANLFGLIPNEPVWICADLGHVLHYGGTVEDIIRHWGRDIGLIHLHGSDGMRDHQSLKYIDKNTLRLIKNFAELQELTVCVEVFEENAFLESLDILLSL